MPLRRDISHEPSVDLDSPTVRFPMADVRGKLVWGEVSDVALWKRAIRDKIKTGLEKKALFARYRVVLEMLASESYDQGRQCVDRDGTPVVAVPLPDEQLGMKST